MKKVGCFIVKQICSNCYFSHDNTCDIRKNKDGKKICSKCQQTPVIYYYVNPKYSKEIVRNFQNGYNTNTKVSECTCSEDRKSNIRRHINSCKYAINDFEFNCWKEMHYIKEYRIDQVYQKYIDRFVYYSRPMNNEIKIYENHNGLHDFRYGDLNRFIHPVPKTEAENNEIRLIEKRRTRFCYFCMNEIRSEKELPGHINGAGHKAFYEVDQLRVWYFPMPHTTEPPIMKNEYQHEYLEVRARLKYRLFMRSFKESCQMGEPVKPISSMPACINVMIPKFPWHLSWYLNNESGYEAIITIDNKLPDKLVLKSVYLRDHEARSFFQFFICGSEQRVDQRNQKLLFDRNSPNPILIGLKFKPLYSATYCQKLEFEFEDCAKLDKNGMNVLRYYQKLIRVDVGTKEHLIELKRITEGFEMFLNNSNEIKKIIPYPDLEEPKLYNMADNLSGIFDIKSNMDCWIESLQSHNYCRHLRNMTVMEELTQRYLVYSAETEFELSPTKCLQMDDRAVFAKPGYLFAKVQFEELDIDEEDMADSRTLIRQYIDKAYIVQDTKDGICLHEVCIVDDYKFDAETRKIDELYISLTEKSWSMLKEKVGKSIKAKLWFRFDNTHGHLVFSRRYNGLAGVIHHDMLEYCPIACPYIDRLPYGESSKRVDQKKIELTQQSEYYSKFSLTEEQRRLCRLVLRKIDSKEMVFPFVLNGAFGTGKSRVLASIVLQILQDRTDDRVFMCTRSYSAAKVFLNVFLDNLTPSQVHQNICLVESDKIKQKTDHKIKDYTMKSCDLIDMGQLTHRVYITALDNALDCFINIPRTENRPLFHYVFVDEAAQVLEVDAIGVFQFGTKSTKFVFAGDVYQIRPSVWNPNMRKFTLPIVSRLNKLYQKLTEYKICLTQVFRTNATIVQFLSQAIYEDSIICLQHLPLKYSMSGKAMEFIETGRSGAEYDNKLKSFKNLKEIEAIFKFLEKFKSKYTRLNNVLVCTHSYAQKRYIINELKKYRDDMRDLKVELPSNVQGEEFDVVLMSTVFTKNQDQEQLILDQTFHSSKNLINLVVTRTKYYLVVFGNAESLLTSGRKKQWQIFFDILKRV